MDLVPVQLRATGLCHSGDHYAKGDISFAILPFVAGHECAGIVTGAGQRVTTLKPGDHVVTSFVPSHGRCRWCATGHQHAGRGIPEVIRSRHARFHTIVASLARNRGRYRRDQSGADMDEFIEWQ